MSTKEENRKLSYRILLSGLIYIAATVILAGNIPIDTYLAGSAIGAGSVIVSIMAVD